MEGLKKYWFVAVVGVILTSFVCFFAFSATKDILPGKKDGGKDVVYTINDVNYTADDYYDQLFEELGVGGLFQFIEQVVINESVETTEEIKAQAKIQTDTTIAQFKSEYGLEYEVVLLQALRGVGYNSVSDLQNFMIFSEKYTVFATEYLSENYDPSLNPQILSHILVKMEDSDNPTAEEQQKMVEVDTALASGTSFGEVAFQYSDDSSASMNGILGYSDVNTNYVPEFLEAALQLTEGETSGWVKTQYGYHLIRCDASTLETLKNYDEFYNGINSSQPDLLISGIWNKAKEMGITFSNPEYETQILTYLGLNGGNEE